MRPTRTFDGSRRSVVADNVRWSLPFRGTGSRSERIAVAVACAVWLLLRPATLSAQAILDDDNRYSNVGAIMVWRVDGAGNPVELRGFASGTLIRERVMVTAGHFTAPASSLGSLPPSIRLFASFSSVDAKDPRTWIPVVGQATHPSMPYCPPPPRCDPTQDDLVAPLQPGIADVGLVFLAHAPAGIKPARLAGQGILRRSEGMETTIVGFGTTNPKVRNAPIDAAWDGRRRFRTSKFRRVVDETWGLWSLPSFVCHGDSGGAIFLRSESDPSDGPVLVGNVSDGGLDCRSHNNNNRLDTAAVQIWIDETVKASGSVGPGLTATPSRCQDCAVKSRPGPPRRASSAPAARRGGSARAGA